MEAGGGTASRGGMTGGTQRAHQKCTNHPMPVFVWFSNNAGQFSYALPAFFSS